MAQQRLRTLYQKYLDDTCTPEERTELMQAIASGQHDDEFQQLSASYWDLHNTTETLSKEKADLIFRNIVAQDTASEKTLPRINRRRTAQWAAAAAVLLVVSVALLFRKPAEKQQAPIALLQVGSASEHHQVKLPDGSTVVLNNRSYLKYPQKFNGAKREVTLEGEGYFDIKHDTAHPFIVHTGNITTTVLGTAFNINAYTAERMVTVTVTRGKVSVSNAEKVLAVITPDEQFVFNKTEGSATQTNVNASVTVEWQSKDLFFEDMSMEEAAAELSDRFNTKISFANDAAKKCRFTGTFLHGEKLADILQVICSFNNASFKTTANGEIIITGPGC